MPKPDAPKPEEAVPSPGFLSCLEALRVLMTCPAAAGTSLSG